MLATRLVPLLAESLQTQNTKPDINNPLPHRQLSEGTEIWLRSRQGELRKSGVALTNQGHRSEYKSQIVAWVLFV
jgi:RNA 3'-terminal phosphate cyclase